MIVIATPPVLIHKDPSLAHATQAILVTVKLVLVSSLVALQ